MTPCGLLSAYSLGALGLVMLTFSACGRNAASPEAAVVIPDDGDAGSLDAASETPAPDAGSCVHIFVEPRCREGYCLIPTGCFIKGSPPDEPYRGRYTEEQRETAFTHSFLMQEHEVTQAEWEAIGFPNLAGTMDDGNGGTDCVEPQCPASMMTWFEAVEYANRLSDRHGYERCIELFGCTGEVDVDFRCTGYQQTTESYYACLGYRLPTAYEFEYAMRAGTTTAFYSGPFEPSSDDCIEVPHLNDTAWYCINAGRRTHPVKQKKPNAWGLYDMMGNASEYIASNPDDFTLSHEPWVDPGKILSNAGIFGSAGGLYFIWPSSMRSAALPLPIDLLYPGYDQRILKGVGSGFRLVRTISEKAAAAW